MTEEPEIVPGGTTELTFDEIVEAISSGGASAASSMAVDPTSSAAPPAARQRFGAPRWPANSVTNIVQTPSYQNFVAGKTTTPPPSLTTAIAMREIREAYDRLFMEYRTPPRSGKGYPGQNVRIGQLPEDPDSKILVGQINRIAAALEDLAAGVTQRHEHLAEADRQADKRFRDVDQVAGETRNATKGIEEVLARSLADNAKRHDELEEQLAGLLTREQYLIDALTEERRRADKLTATLDKALDRIDLLESDILRLEKQP